MGTSRFDEDPLSQQSLTELQILNAIELYEENPLQALYSADTEMTLTEDFKTPVQRDVRTGGVWFAKPNISIPAARESFGMLQGFVLHQGYKDFISRSAGDAIRTHDMNVPQFSQGVANALREGGRREVQRIIRAFTALCLRNREIYSGKMLSTSGSFTLKISGADVVIDTGLTENTTFGGWGTATTDIVAHLPKMLRLFREETGGNPDVIVYSDRLNDDFADNEELRAILNGGNGMFNFASFPDAARRVGGAALAGTNFVASSQWYDETAEGGTRQYIWPKYKITMFRNRGTNGSNTICNKVVGTPDDNFQGGLYTDSWEVKEVGTAVKVGDNFGPFNANPEQMMLWNVE